MSIYVIKLKNKNLPSKIRDFLTQTIQNVISWGSEMANKGRNAAVNLFNAIIKEIPSKMLSIGNNIVSGIWVYQIR